MQGHLALDEVAESPVQPDFEPFHPHHNKILPFILTE